MTLSIYAVGDIMLGEQPLCAGFGVKSVIEKKGTDYLFRDVKRFLKKGDIVFGNLEAPLSRNTSKKGIYANFFRGDPFMARELRNNGFNAVSIANNHIMDHGLRAFYETVNNLENKGITPVGIADKITLFNISGYRIALLAYSFVEDFAENVPYNKIKSETKIINDLTKIRKSVDLIIVSLHWGYEYIPYPSPEQIKIGRNIIDHGADIILGSHPHVLQGYEIYRGRPIVYSLGNFIFDQTFIRSTRKSAILEIKILNTNPVEIHVRTIPIIIDPKDYQPKVADKETSELVSEYMENIRKAIENRPLSTYVYAKNYMKLANKYKRTAKMQMYVHFIKNLYKYPPSLIADLVIGKIWR